MEISKKQIANKFKNEILTITSKQNENEIQKYLEENTDFIPTPILLNHGIHFNFIISKLHLSESLLCDFAYLTKSTVEWRLVLIEIEASTKKIFTNNNRNIYFSSEFNNSYDQLLSWRTHILNNPDDIKNKLSILMGSMGRNPMSIEYLLIIGRGSELNSEEKKNMFVQKNRDGIRVFTYDSFIMVPVF